MSISQNVMLAFAGTDGIVQSLNGGFSDNTTPIYYEVETQELEFGNRGHLKKIANRIVILGNFGIDSQLLATQDGEVKSIPVESAKRVNIGNDVNLEGRYFTFLWKGMTTTNQPILEGFVIDDVTDMGITKG